MTISGEEAEIILVIFGDEKKLWSQRCSLHQDPAYHESSFLNLACTRCAEETGKHLANMRNKHHWSGLAMIQIGYFLYRRERDKRGVG